MRWTARCVPIFVTCLLVAATWCARGDDDQADEKPPYGCACNPIDDPDDDITDEDGDGYAAIDDCDDSNPAVHPGAEEACNLIDDDCDGLVDDGTERSEPWFAVGREGDTPLRVLLSVDGAVLDSRGVDIGLSPGDEAGGLLLADIDADGIDDLLMQSADQGWVASFTPDCDGGWLRTDLFDTVYSYRLRGAGDVDGDGDVDLVTLNTGTWTGHVWNNDGHGSFTVHAESANWEVIGAAFEDASLVDSQQLLDLTGDGRADWLLCLGRSGQTYCYVAEGHSDGSLRGSEHLFTDDDLQAVAATLGYFDGDGYPDLLFGLGPQVDGEQTSCIAYLLSGQPDGGLSAVPQPLFDLVVEAEGDPWGFGPEDVGDGWMRALALDPTAPQQDQLLVVLEVVGDDDDGYALLHVRDPLAVDSTPGVQLDQIRPLLGDLIGPTSSADPHQHSVVVTGVPAR